MKKILLFLSLVGLFGCKSPIKKSELTESPKIQKESLVSEKKTAVSASQEKPERIGSSNVYRCQVNKDTRLVEFKKENGRCEIHYTKFGTSQQVAWAESTPTICPEVYDRIRSNIESKGFTCQDVSKELAAK